MDKGLPRDGGLADLLAEARSPAPRFAAVVCEDIERSGRDTFNALKLERELGDNGILLFAADEPIDLDGTDPATILLRRTKQNIAEYFRLSLKQKMWRGLRTHAAQGYNLGKVLDGYLPEKIPHPAPSKASQGRTKTLLVLDEQRAPIIAAIYQMRAEEKLGVPGHPRPAVRRPGHLPARRPRHRLDARRPVFDPGQPEIHRVPGVRPDPPGQARPARPVVLAGPAHPPRDRRPRGLAGRPAGRGRAPQLTRRRHPQPGQLAQLPVPVPGPLQNLQTAHVRPDQGARRQQDPDRVRVLRVPVQPADPQPRGRRPRSPAHGAGPGRCPAGRDVPRPGGLRAGARPGTAPGRAHPAHRHRPASPARPPGRRPGQTAQAADRPAREPDARTGRVLRHG